MINEYHRPETIGEALELLNRKEPRTIPIGGGSAVERYSPEPLAVVDLQALPLGGIRQQGNTLELGARATLENLLSVENLQPELKRAILLEAGANLRHVATVAGALVSADGRSPFTTAMLALDTALTWLAGAETRRESISLGDLLPVRSGALPGRLITEARLPLNAGLAYDQVARSPADQPIVCVAVALWPSRRTRVALGGFGKYPILAMDGPEPGGVEAAVQNAYSQAQDQWASAEYRQEVAVTLAKRCLEQLQKEGNYEGFTRI